MSKGIECADHLGNVFKSKRQRAKCYGLKQETIDDRLYRIGMSLEEALTTPIDISRIRSEQCTDHLGNVFKSKRQRAKYYGLNESTICLRLKDGMSLKEALTTPLDAHKKNKCTDHLGNIFESETDRAEFYNTTIKTINGRLLMGYSLEKALTDTDKKAKQCTDHLGNIFKSKSERARHYNINMNTVEERLKDGMSLEEALTKSTSRDLHLDPIRNINTTFEEMSEYYNANINSIKSKYNKKPFVRLVQVSLYIPYNAIKINRTKYNLTIVKRIKRGKDVFECYIDNGDGTSTFKIMTYDMIDQYCLEQYKKLHNIA